MSKFSDEELIDLVAEGATVVEMTGILGVTWPAIEYRLGKLGLKAAKAAPPSTTEIMSATGLSAGSMLGSRCGRSLQTSACRVKQSSIASNRWA